MNKESINYRSLVSTIKQLPKDDLFQFFLSACIVGDLGLCQACLDAGANINITESFHKNNLLISLIENSGNSESAMKVYRWLIDNNININYHDSAHTALNTACRCGYYNLAFLLIRNGAEVLNYGDKRLKFESDLAAAVSSENIDLIKLLLISGAKINLDDYGDPPLLRAVKNNNYEITKLLLFYRANPKSDALSNYSYNHRDPLKTAVTNGNIDIAKLLIDYGADPNYRYKRYDIFYRSCKDDIALTYMDIAINNKDIKMQEMLAGYGCEASTKEEKIQVVIDLFNNKNSVAEKVLKNLMLQ